MADLCQGANQVGLDHILNELVPKALDGGKKIVWVVEDEGFGTGHYELINNYLFSEVL
ncbi:hypothetical protein [Terrimonas sp.]|uniref:hypothetical protein n=1 Tax=Terrimonas sp. TaxID=1914338 RepID=UPI0014020AB8|nr:hypothetical protein [Terrimonas sp.]